VSSMRTGDVSESRLVEMRRRAWQHRSIYAYSVVTIALLTVVGPALSVLFGIGGALLMVLPILYANAIAAVIDVGLARKSLNMPLSGFLYLAFEFIVCPALVVNLNKRLLDRSLMPNTLQLVGDDKALLARISSHLEYLDPTAPRMRLDENG